MCTMHNCTSTCGNAVPRCFQFHLAESPFSVFRVTPFREFPLLFPAGVMLLVTEMPRQSVCKRRFQHRFTVTGRYNDGQ